jgi:hypothetical protein
MQVSLGGIDTLCDIPLEGVISVIDKSVAQWNEEIVNICHNVRVISSKSYGRIYLRWYVVGSQQRCANFENLDVTLNTGQKLKLAIYQQELEKLNAQIALRAKRERAIGKNQKPT